MTPIEMISVCVAGVMAFFTCCSGFFMWRNGTPQVSSDVVTTYKARIEQLIGENKETKEYNTKEIKELSAQVNQLIGQGKEKDNMISTLQSIMQGRNPEMVEFMRIVSSASADNTKFIQETAPILRGVGDFFDKLKSGQYIVVPAPQTNS